MFAATSANEEPFRRSPLAHGAGYGRLAPGLSRQTWLTSDNLPVLMNKAQPCFLGRTPNKAMYASLHRHGTT